MKKIKVLLIALLIILISMSFTATYAAERMMGAQEARPFTNSIYKFRAGANGEDKVYTVVKIYDNLDKNAQNELSYSKAIYCLRGGVGFGADSTTDVSKTPIGYTEFGEMHANAKSVIEKYEELYNVNLDRTETINNKQVNIYNAILWIVDEAYLPVDKTNYDASEYKTELLEKVGIHSSKHADITDDDLEVIQQLAIWYFANYDEQKAGDLQSVSSSTKFPAQFLSINNNNNMDSKKEENLNKIYQYFIYGAIDNSNIYQTDSNGTRTQYIAKNEFDDTVKLEIKSVDYQETRPNIYHPELYYYEIGPFKIKNDVNENIGKASIDLTDVVLYDANGTPVKRLYEIPVTNQVTGEVESGGYNKVYSFVDSKGKEVTELEKGTNYYIRVKKLFTEGFQLGDEESPIPDNEKYDVSEVTLKVSSVYSLSKATFLTRQKADQALVEIDKEKVYESDEISTKLPKQFDLSLRKFITFINGKELTGENSRVPSINTNTLINGLTNRDGTKEYTATYTHPKNALQVETGNKVIYTIRIYNEGEVDGTATEVTDYLPSGLELVPAENSKINAKYGWKKSDKDEKIIVTDYLKNTTIKAFDKALTEEKAGNGWQKANTGVSGLYYADLEVECIVKAEATGTDQELRNIAAITADTGDDRDSVPGDPGRDNYNPPADNSTYKEDDDDYEDLVLLGKTFDLSLRKFITKIERTDKETNKTEKIEIASREPIIEIKGLKDGTSKTARYVHPKNKISLKRGDIIYYTIRVYNEGELDGYVKEVKDYLPQGLELVEGQNDIWTVDGNTLTTDILKDQKLLGYNKDITSVEQGIKWQKASDDETGLYYYDLTVVCKIKQDVKDAATLVNIAEITADEAVPEDTDDRDSKPGNFPDENKNNNYEGNGEDKGYYPGKQDDDDFERVTVEPDEVFDLALRKFITSIKRNGEEVEFEDRTPHIDTTTLIKGTFDRNGKKEYTATYEHSKEPLVVRKGDVVTYTLRIYNEGERDGFATEITDYIPEGLALILNYNTNFENGWKLQENFDYDKLMNLVGEEGFYKTEKDVKNLSVKDFEDIESLKDVQLATGEVSITTSMLQDELIKSFDKKLTQENAGEGWQKAEKGEGGLYYKDIEISCLVIAENTCKDVLINEAEISEDKDENKQDVDDRDSTPDNVANKNEDDDDYEPVILKYFDLALRKFITGVETNGKTKEITSRIPVPKMGEDGNIVYEHTKDPVLVANNDTVIYTIRVYNEGTLAGYAEEITDDIPEGLEFLPKHNTNKEYEWVMIDKDGKVTKDVKEAVKITTDYLSEDKEIKSKMTVTDETTGETTASTNDRDNLINVFDSSKEISNENPHYKDVKVAFRVVEPNTSDRIIINSAQISEDSDDDEDSIPGEWNEGEDDQDKEYIYVKYFDLSLLKWVTQTVVTVDGKTTTTETGFEPNTGKTETTGIRDNKEPEPIAKVELDRRKLKKTTVKFVYNIKVTNEGEIAGYATEITDYIPKGLEFFSEDNKAFGWEKDGDKKVTTRALETVLLKPGESATLSIVFRWKNSTENLGLKTNVAEISEDYNEHNSKDIDSVPDNKKDPYEKEQEDDDDFALVILSIKTGKGASYAILIISMLTLLASGMYLIKKYVLRY